MKIDKIVFCLNAFLKAQENGTKIEEFEGILSDLVNVDEIDETTKNVVLAIINDENEPFEEEFEVDMTTTLYKRITKNTDPCSGTSYVYEPVEKLNIKRQRKRSVKAKKTSSNGCSGLTNVGGRC